MNVYAFDVDETLELSGGPVKIVDVVALRAAGHIVGLCGNWGLVTQVWPGWHTLFSFLGPMKMKKEEFLEQLATYIPATEHVMVGNLHLISGASDDSGAARLAGWRFIQEKDFAAGAR
jgi:hypothetical protein